MAKECVDDMHTEIACLVDYRRRRGNTRFAIDVSLLRSASKFDEDKDGEVDHHFEEVFALGRSRSHTFCKRTISTA